MATHSSVLVSIPGTGEPGGLPSMGSHRVGNDCSDSAAAAAAEGNRQRQAAKRPQAKGARGVLRGCERTLLNGDL